MSLEVMAWNVCDGFSKESHARRLIGEVQDLSPAATIFTEAYAEGKTGLIDNIQEDFESSGYVVTHGLYEDTDGRADRHGLLSVVHASVVHPDMPGELVSLGNRNAVSQWLIDPEDEVEKHLIGVHLNDRSEAKRLEEVDVLLRDVITDQPTAIVGDFNGTHAESARGVGFKITHLISRMVELKLLPIVDPGEPGDSGLAHIGSLGVRLHEMAFGTVMQMLGDAEFTDADPAHTPTMPARIPFAQIDHIMTSPQLSARNFRVLPFSDLSDHRGILATIQ